MRRNFFVRAAVHAAFSVIAAFGSVAGAQVTGPVQKAPTGGFDTAQINHLIICDSHYSTAQACINAAGTHSSVMIPFGQHAGEAYTNSSNVSVDDQRTGIPALSGSANDSTARSSAASAQTSADNAQSTANTASTNASSALSGSANDSTARANAASAQSTANAALPANGCTSTTGGNVVCPGAVSAGAVYPATAPVYNPKSPIYGAAFDGVTDDSTAIAAAFNAAKAGSGGTIQNPDGSTVININPFPVQQNKSVTWRLGYGKVTASRQIVVPSKSSITGMNSQAGNVNNSMIIAGPSFVPQLTGCTFSASGSTGTVSCGSAHNLALGNFVLIEGTSTDVDSAWKVLTTPTSSSFTFSYLPAGVAGTQTSLSGLTVDIPLIWWGDQVQTAGDADAGAVLERLSVDCNSLANSIGVFTSSANEGSFLRSMQVRHCTRRGVWVKTTSNGFAANWGPDEDLTIYMDDTSPSTVGTAVGYAVDLKGTAATGLLRSTIRPFSVPNAGMDGVEVSGMGGGTFIGIHCEEVKNCIHFTTASGSASSGVTTNVTTCGSTSGSMCTGAVIKIDSAAGASNTFLSTVRGYASGTIPATIDDAPGGHSTSGSADIEDGAVALYIEGNSAAWPSFGFFTSSTNTENYFPSILTLRNGNPLRFRGTDGAVTGGMASFTASGTRAFSSTTQFCIAPNSTSAGTTTTYQSCFLTDGGFQLSAQSTQGSCSSTARASFKFVSGGTGVADHLYQCMKNASDTYAWQTIY